MKIVRKVHSPEAVSGIHPRRASREKRTTVPKKPTVTRNDRPRVILEALVAHPEADPAEVTRLTGIPVGAVRRWFVKHRERGEVREVTLIKHALAGRPMRIMISLNVDSLALRSEKYRYFDQQGFRKFLLERLSRQKEFAPYAVPLMIETVYIVLGGPSDFVLLMAAPNADAVLRFVTYVLRLLPGVRNTTTAMIFEDLPNLPASVKSHGRS